MISLFDAPADASHDFATWLKRKFHFNSLFAFFKKWRTEMRNGSVTLDGNNRNRMTGIHPSFLDKRIMTFTILISQLLSWNNVLFRQTTGRSRRRSCWSTAWWRLLGTPAPPSMKTPAALASTWRWSSPVEEQWSERRYLSTCWRNPESSTRQCKYHFLLSLSFSMFL